jgi:predicted nucleotidyltransferase
MATRDALTVPAAFLRIRAAKGDRPFSPGDVERCTGKTGVANYVVLSRLNRSGWLLRLGRGRYATAEPAVRMDPQLEHRLTPFRRRCFYPTLQRTVAGILRVYSGEVVAVALFGSAARGTDGPESDLDLLVVVEHRTTSPIEDARTRARVGRFSTDVRMEEWDLNRHFHQVQLVLVDRSDLLRPGPMFLDLPKDARVLWDPSGMLRTGLRRFATRLRRAGAHRVHSRRLGTYWKLGRAFGEGVA